MKPHNEAELTEILSHLNQGETARLDFVSFWDDAHDAGDWAERNQFRYDIRVEVEQALVRRK